MHSSWQQTAPGAAASCPIAPISSWHTSVQVHSAVVPACHTCLQGGLWWATADAGHQGVVFRLLRALALVGTLMGLEGRVLLPAFGHYLGLHHPWNYITISAALFGAGSLLLLHFEGVSPGCQLCWVSARVGSNPCSPVMKLLQQQLAQLLHTPLAMVNSHPGCIWCQLPVQGTQPCPNLSDLLRFSFLLFFLSLFDSVK